MEEVFEEWNVYAKKRVLKSRAIDLDKIKSDSKLKIVAITGIRRAGKTSLLMLLLQKLISEGKRSAYINLEDSRIKDSKEVLDEILKWFGDSGYLLLDEITCVRNWSGWLARNHELLKGRLHLIISSSRKKLATPAKPLRGRIIPYELYPLSFSEFLQFKNIKVEKTTAGIGKIEKALSEYLVFGGFPEVVLLDNKTDKVKLLNSYFKDIIALDVAEISGENITAIELFGKYVIETPYFSASKCLNFFKSLGYKIGKSSILNLERHAQDSYLFYFVPIFSQSIKNRSQYPRKSYLGDTGFMYAISGRKDFGRLFENAVFLELKRRLPMSHTINYWKSREGFEVDFIVCEGVRAKQIIQVCYTLDDEKTKEREIRSLIACAKEFGLRTGLVITREESGTEKIRGIRIQYVPLWKWLLT